MNASTLVPSINSGLQVHGTSWEENKGSILGWNPTRRLACTLGMKDADSLLWSLDRDVCNDAAIEAEGKEQAALDQPEYDPLNPVTVPLPIGTSTSQAPGSQRP